VLHGCVEQKTRAPDSQSIVAMEIVYASRQTESGRQIEIKIEIWFALPEVANEGRRDSIEMP